MADRITKPTVDSLSQGMNAGAAPFVPSKTSWADEVASPVDSVPAPSIPTDKKTEEPKEPTMPQTDGAGEHLGGSELHEPDYSVMVKLSDMQMDPNNPLFSVKSFEELGLYVSSLHLPVPESGS